MFIQQPTDRFVEVFPNLRVLSRMASVDAAALRFYHNSAASDVPNDIALPRPEVHRKAFPIAYVAPRQPRLTLCGYPLEPCVSKPSANIEVLDVHATKVDIYHLSALTEHPFRHG